MEFQLEVFLLHKLSVPNRCRHCLSPRILIYRDWRFPILMLKSSRLVKVVCIVVAAILLVSIVPSFLSSGGIASLERKVSASSGSSNGGNLVIGYTAEPADIFNPIILFTATAYGINSLTYESLFQWNQNLKLIPDLATSYTVSPDGLTYTFNLRQNVNWSDGYPFTAQDVKFTIAVTLNQSLSAGFFYTPLSEPSTHTITGVTLNESSVSIPNNYTIVFHLMQPYSPFLLYVSSLPTLAEHVLIGQNLTNDNYINQHIVGTGPFIVTQYVVGSHVSFEANPNYWGGRPHLNNVTYVVF